MPNQYFDNIPIEYKEINEDDFDSKLYNVESKHLIELDEKDNGFIGNKLLPILSSDFENRNTTVINAGVGQGKTTAILEVVKEYANNDEYIVIIAVPYKSLIKQYVKDCSTKDSKNKIFNLIEFDEVFRENKNATKIGFGYVDEEEIIRKSKLKSIDVSYFDIHVLTVNALLGNSGDNLFQSSQRAKYFKNLQEYCEDTNKKIILLFDEIHDSIHNFEEQYIFKLWNFQRLVQKVYIVSATFSEASKEVIKYLSEFTDKKIKIIESERKPKLEKQSDLHLHFYKNRYVHQDSGLFKLIQKLIQKFIESKENSFDILVYSKSLAKNLIKELLNKTKLEEGDINRCYSDVFDRGYANKEFNPNKINIGTNFSTGISIEKKKHDYIILLPQELNIKYLNNNGIFTNGYNIIIQSLARQREVGNIYMFLPQPLGINASSFPYTKKQQDKLFNVFEEVKGKSDEVVVYSNINTQKKNLESVYYSLVNEVKIAKDNIINADRDANLNRLLYPSIDIFKLKLGEKHLVKTYFKGNFSAYVLWASVCNQFLNCRLKSISGNYKISLNSKSLYSDIVKVIEKEKKFMYDAWDNLTFIKNTNNYDSKENYNIVNDLSTYELVEFIDAHFFEDTTILIDALKATKAETKKISLMIMNYIISSSDNFNSRKDKRELSYYYLKSCIYFANKLKKYPDNFFSKSKIKCIEIYTKWYQIFLLLEQNVKASENGNRLKSKISDLPELKKLFDDIELKKSLQIIFEEDELFSKEIFTLKDTIRKSKDIHQTFYKEIVNSFYECETKRTTKNGKSTSYLLIHRQKNLKIKNLLYKDLPEVIL